MNAFHVYWTPSKKERIFSDYFILTLILSAMQWKRTHEGRLTFYGDKKTVDFLYKCKLTDLWDRCDPDTLDREIDLKHYDVSTFVTIGKFAAFLKEQAPCAMVDVDLVVWENLAPLLEGKEAAFTHWESGNAGSLLYPGPDKLHVREGYQFHPAWDFGCMPVNTSFMYFREDKWKEYYVDCAMEYMRDNWWPDKASKNTAIMFVEQKLLPMCLNEQNLQDKCRSLLDIVWDADAGRFQVSQGMPEGWKFFEWDNGSAATHIWIAKQAIEKNEKYRNYMCCRAIEKILQLDGRLAGVLEEMQFLQKYLLLLEKYGSAKGAVRAGEASMELYS